MQLRYISVPLLIAEAGGDPWAINQSLQVGRPAQIADLAEAFHAAGRCTAESNTAFEQARNRFESAWNHENGGNPINDSAEVQRTAQALGAQSVQLPKIGTDLENIAATLAEAQKSAAGQIATLERQLQQLDDIIAAAVEQEKDPNLTPKARNDLNAVINACEDDAVDDTKSALGQLESLRDGYAGTLQRSLATVRTDGYDPGILRNVDADTKIPPPGTSAEDVNRWWTSLTPQERQHLIAEHPEEVGNLNGVPVGARSDVNEAVMNDDLHRVEDIANQNGVSVNDVLNDPGRYGLSASAVMRYNNAVQTRNGLNTA